MKPIPILNIQDIVNTYKDAAVLISDSFEIISANPAYLELYTIDSSCHTSVSESKQYCYNISHHYSRSCDQEGESCPLQLAKSTQTKQRVLHIHHTCYGEEHVDVSLYPIKDSEGQLYFLEVMKTVKHASPQSIQEGMVGKSASFNQLLNLINRVAEHDISVLLQGESGTGKELVAHAIHQASSRNEMACVTVECSGLSETLFESELFGHERGSFTGAVSQKKGLIEEAKGGTLFLDEIGDVPLNLQVKLLRLIETRMFRRVGGVEQLHTNFRLICATHKDLLQMVRMGKFREDLYYRISTFPLHLPALRERIEDIPLLVKTILERITGSKKMQVSDDALMMLGRYYFPGNIRQLRNLLEFACVMTDSNIIEQKHFPSDLSREERPNSSSSIIDYDDFESSHQKLMTLEQHENNYISHLTSYFSDKKLLATKLGISERTLYRKLQLCRKQNVAIKESE